MAKWQCGLGVAGLEGDLKSKYFLPEIFKGGEKFGKSKIHQSN
jgi:hypothetical protein